MPRGMEKYTQVPKISDPIKVDRRSLSSDLKNKDAEEAAPSQNEDQVEQKEEKAKLKDYFEAELSSRAIEDLVDRICDGSFNYRELLNESLIEFGLAKAGHEDARKRRAEILTSFVNRLEDGLAYNQDIFSDEDYQAGQELLNRIFEHAQLMGMDIAALANKAEFARRASVEAKKSYDLKKANAEIERLRQEMMEQLQMRTIKKKIIGRSQTKEEPREAYIQ